jgi:hypothetical protein
MTPTIHSNGTSRDALLTLTCDAGRAVRLAMEAVAAAAPNARDYYPQGPDAITQAMAAQDERLRLLRQMWIELGEEAEAIADA